MSILLIWILLTSQILIIPKIPLLSLQNIEWRLTFVSGSLFFSYLFFPSSFYENIIKRTLLKKAIQAKISSLKWKGILYNNQQIQQGVGQLSTINHSWVKKVFLESIVLLFGQNKSTNMGTFFSKQEFLASKKYEKVHFQLQWLQHILSKS